MLIPESTWRHSQFTIQSDWVHSSFSKKFFLNFTFLLASLHFNSILSFQNGNFLGNSQNILFNYPQEAFKGIKMNLLPKTKIWTADEVRKEFISFYNDYNHKICNSSSVVPSNDSSLLFVNSGMNQFKPLFIKGVSEHPSNFKFLRAVNCQKCIRAGGKHNDLDDVGKDGIHHTFFEMLGSWSFGDYFKLEAIQFAWELITKVFKLDPARIYVTYFNGDKENPQLRPDLETKEIWSNFVPSRHIFPFDMKRNFWEMAETGPCGPCTEIYYDRIGCRDLQYSLANQNSDIIEIWNLVFLEFNRNENGSLTYLPKRSVDTGMGLERILFILQGANNTYDTEVFQPIFEKIQEVLSVPIPYKGKFGKFDLNMIDTSYRVIADHIRCLTVAISDCVDPSNYGRGYILRRILRRALRYGNQYLNNSISEPWLFRLVEPVISTLKTPFPELNQNKQRIMNIILQEEIQFSKTLSEGIKKFNCILSKLIANPTPNNIFPTNLAFTLQSSLGLPLDLLCLMVHESGYKIDFHELKKLQEEHKNISKKKIYDPLINTSNSFTSQEAHHLHHSLGINHTDDSYKYNLGQNDTNFTPFISQIVAIYDTNFINSAPSGSCALILDKTTYFSEDGGQSSDCGEIIASTGIFLVKEVKKIHNYVLHIGILSRGSLMVGDQVELRVNMETRRKNSINHTATHLLSFALRNITRSSCQQRGSKIDKNYIRFDFEVNKKDHLPQWIEPIQSFVNNMIKADYTVYTQKMKLPLALELKGIRYLNETVYPPNVRIVSIGEDVPSIIKLNKNNFPGLIYSIELCGGTHALSLGQINKFTILHHSNISKGVYRILACTNEAAAQIEINDKLGEMLISALESTPIDKLGKVSPLDKMKPFSELNFSHLRRSNFTHRLNLIMKHQITYTKNMEATQIKLALKQIQNSLKKHHSSDWILEHFSKLSLNLKALSKVLKQTSKFGKPAFLISSDNSSSINVACCIPPKNSSEHSLFSASEWINFTLYPIGNGGGNRYIAMGSTELQLSLNLINDLANSYASEKFYDF